MRQKVTQRLCGCWSFFWLASLEHHCISSFVRCHARGQRSISPLHQCINRGRKSRLLNSTDTMKTYIAVIIAATSLLLAGCCTPSHANKWEYKVVIAPQLPAAAYQSIGTNKLTAATFGDQNREVQRLSRENQQRFLNELGKDGWILISDNEGTLYLRRTLR